MGAEGDQEEGREEATRMSRRVECHGSMRFVMARRPLPAQRGQGGPETAGGGSPLLFSQISFWLSIVSP